MTASDARSRTTAALASRGIERFLAPVLSAVERDAARGLSSLQVFGLWKEFVPTPDQEKAVWQALRDLGFQVDPGHQSGLPKVSW